MSNLLSNLQKLPKVRSCRPVYIVDQHRKNPKKNCRAGCRERKRISIEATSLQGCPKNFFFFRSLNLPSRLLCDFYTCWPKIALRRQQHCLLDYCLLHADCVESVKRGGVKLSSLRCRLAVFFFFVLFCFVLFFLSLRNKIYCLVFALLLLSMY